LAFIQIIVHKTTNSDLVLNIGMLIAMALRYRYVASMAAQELCSSNDLDIIDAATLEGNFV
jgi:hypothetical protein